MIVHRPEEIVGRRLDAIQYDIFEWDSAPQTDEAVDVVPGSVMFNLQGQTFSLSWELNPPSEQLVMTRAALEVRPLMRRVDVSGRWPMFVGARVLAAAWSYHETGDGLEPWAVTLAFAQAGDLVIALGELSAGGPSYTPDALVVIAATEIARAYQPPAALGAAWADVRGRP